MISHQALVRLADYSEQAAVTNLPGRLAAIAITLGCIALALLGMRRGWLARQRRQADVPEPIRTPVPGFTATTTVDGVYLGTSRVGDWLDRIAVHGLGVRCQGGCAIGAEGIWLDLAGARAFFIPRDDIVDIRVDRGVAATVRSKDSVIVISWRLGDSQVDSGFRAQSTDGQVILLAAITEAGVPRRTEATA